MIIFNSTFALCTFFYQVFAYVVVVSFSLAPFQSPQLIRFWKSVLIDVAVDAVYSECHHHSNQIQIQIQNNQAREKNRRRRNKFAYKFDINWIYIETITMIILLFGGDFLQMLFAFIYLVWCVIARVVGKCAKSVDSTKELNSIKMILSI